MIAETFEDFVSRAVHNANEILVKQNHYLQEGNTKLVLENRELKQKKSFSCARKNCLIGRLLNLANRIIMI